MNREALDTWLERAILALVLGTLVFGTLALGGVRPSEFIVLWWLIVAALALWAVRIWAAPKFRFLWPPICWAILPFVGYAIWRYRTADIEFVARQELIQILVCALLFLLVVNNLHSQESTRLLVFTLVFLAMAVSMYGIFQWLRSSETVWGLARPPMYFERASGSFINPNHLAGFLEMILPLGIALTVTGRVKPITRIYLAYASFVVLVGLVATQSRGGWCAAAAGLLVLCVVLLRTKVQRWIALTVLVLVTTTGINHYTDSLTNRITGTVLSGHGQEIRLRLWNYAWQLWKTEPWVGVGPDHFDHRFQPHREPIDRTQGRPGRAHNDYVNTLADYGAIGLALVLLPLGIGAWSLVRCWPHLQRGGSDLGKKPSNRAAIVLGAASGLVALLVHSFFDFNMHIPANAFLAVTLLAVIAAHLRFATERHWVTARWPFALAGTVALAGSLYYLVPQAVTRTRETALLHHAEKLPDGAPKKIALLEAAFAVEPKDFETAFAIGEQLRALSWMGRENFKTQAEEALVWFRRAFELNKWDANTHLRCGMGLDWLGRTEEAGPYFRRALELDPNHWLTRTLMGWHEYQLEHFEESRRWMEKALQVKTINPMAYTYLTLAAQKIREQNEKTVAPKQGAF